MFPIFSKKLMKEKELILPKFDKIIFKAQKFSQKNTNRSMLFNSSTSKSKFQTKTQTHLWIPQWNILSIRQLNSLADKKFFQQQNKRKRKKKQNAEQHFQPNSFWNH